MDDTPPDSDGAKFAADFLLSFDFYMEKACKSPEDCYLGKWIEIFLFSQWIAFADVNASREKYKAVRGSLFSSDRIGIQPENVKYRTQQIFQTKGLFFYLRRICLILWASYAFEISRVVRESSVIGYYASLPRLLEAIISLAQLYSKAPIPGTWRISLSPIDSVDELLAVIRYDGFVDMGKKIFKICICPHGLGYESQSDFNAFPWLLMETEESTASFQLAFSSLLQQVFISTRP